MNDNFENIIKAKLSDYQVDYGGDAWKKLKQDLPANNKGSSKYYFLTVLASGFFIIMFFIYKNNFSDLKITAAGSKLTLEESRLVRSVNNVEIFDVQENYYLSPLLTKKNNDYNVEASQLEIPVPEDTVEQEKVDTAKFKDTEANIPEKKPNALFEIAFTNNCQPLAVQFRPYELSDTIIYYWEFGDGQFSNNKKPTHSYSVPGLYDIILHVKYFHSETISSYTDQIEVFQKPVADFNWNQTDNKVVFINNSLSSNKYKWNFNIPGLISEVEEPVIYFDNEGEYLVSLIAESSEGCLDTVTKPVVVQFANTLYIPDAFKPDGNGICDFFAPKGIGLEVAEYSMNIYDGYGKLVFTTRDIHDQWNGKIGNSGQDARKGIYQCVVKVKYSNGKQIKKVKNIRLLK